MRRAWVALLFFVFAQTLLIRIDVGVTCLVVPTAPRRTGLGYPRTTSFRFFTTSSRFSDVQVSDDNLLNESDRNHLTSLVKARADARARGDYASADAIKQEIYDSISLPEGTQLQIRDVPRKEGGGSTWKLVPSNDETTMPMEGTTVLQLAHAALGLAMSSARDSSTTDLNILEEQAKQRLKQTELVQLELRGRKAADAAFWFALAGATDTDLFDLLANISGKELNRYGTKTSCRAKDVWHVLERLAAAGICSHSVVEQAAVDALASKEGGGGPSHALTRSPSGLLDFHSDRCLLMIWKFSTRQRKQRAFLQSALQHWEQQHAVDGKATRKRLDNNDTAHAQDIPWSDLYKDPQRPFVIDIGCGMGVSLLGLARCEANDDSSLLLGGLDWPDCNFAGVDLSALAIGYARGLSHRWHLDDRLHFFVDNAESFMERVLATYPGPVHSCLLQFPTPYRLQPPSDSAGTMEQQRGNSQLPSNETSGFMVTSQLLGLIHDALHPSDGTLLIQSNCEDVAVFMRQTACDQVGFECVESDTNEGEVETELESMSVGMSRIPKRTLDWISMGGERAEGRGWSNAPILPRVGRTETEVACMANGTPVHRCLLRVSPTDVKH
jgi:hypothetical protein